jgi:replicative DNA helicase
MRENKSKDVVYGRVPPFAKELEQAVLGAIMLEKAAFYEVSEIINHEVFYLESHQIIFKCFEVLDSKNMPIDLLTVCELLQKTEELDKVGGAYYVSQLTSNIFSSANIVTHSRIILQKYVQRKVISTCSEMIGMAYEDGCDSFELISKMEAGINEMNKIITNSKVIDVEQIAFDIIKQLDTKSYNARNDIENVDDIYTEIREWDMINGALFPGLYIVAARPAMGKTTHMVELMCRMGKKVKVGVINGEMTNQQLLTRVGCNLKSIGNKLWKKNAKLITDEELDLVKEAMSEAINLKMVIDDHTNINKVVGKIKTWVRQEGVKVVLADVLSKFKVSEEKKRYMTDLQETNYVINQFSEVAREFKVPIILYAHLNRELYKRGSKEPNLSDLKGSGNIEDFAYQVSFLHRPEYYEPDVIVDENGQDIKGLMYQIIAKHRDGELARLKFKSFLSKCQIKEWDGRLEIDSNTPF